MAKHIKVGDAVNAAEEWAISFLASNLPDGYTLISNVELYSQTGQPFEVDLVVIGRYSIYLVDVKGYEGRLKASKDVWSIDGRGIDNPLPKLNHNCRILASQCKKRTKHNQHAPWCQATVFVTGGEGGDVCIDRNGWDLLPVFSKEDILEALTKKEYVTSQCKYLLEQYQKDLALSALCDFKLIQDRESTLGGYKKEYQIKKDGQVEVWQVCPSTGSLDFKYWMKLVDLTQRDIVDSKERLKNEYRYLSELSEISCTPTPLYYFDNGENVCLVHSQIQGEQLSEVSLSFDNAVKALYSFASDIQKIHAHGLCMAGLDESNLYINQSGNITLDNISLVVEVAKSEQEMRDDSKRLVCVFSPHFFSPNGSGSLAPVDELSQKPEIEAWLAGVINGEDCSISGLIEKIEDETNDLKKENTFIVEAGALLGDKYRFIEILGRGSTSVVWRVQHLIGDYECCIKIFDDFDGCETLARQEYEILRASYHPNIVRIFDLDRLPSSGSLYLTAQYINGNTLDQSEISDDKLWQYFKQMLSALQYIHRINILHKDVKPQNIIIESGKSFLIDFNLSAFETPAIGTMKYKDPNVYKFGWSRFSDIYSLVLSFLEVSIKSHPFQEHDELPQIENKVELPKKIEGVSQSTRSRLQQVINHEVDWSVVSDYLSWFGLEAQSDINLPSEFRSRWGISEGYMSKVVSVMLSDMQPRSRQVVINNTLKAYGLVGNKSTRASLSATISSLKTKMVIAEKGKKIHLSSEFVGGWRGINYH